MYDGDSNVTITGVEGDKDNGILTVTSNVTGTGATGTYTLYPMELQVEMVLVQHLILH